MYYDILKIRKSLGLGKLNLAPPVAWCDNRRQIPIYVTTILMLRYTQIKNITFDIVLNMINICILMYM